MLLFSRQRAKKLMQCEDDCHINNSESTWNNPTQLKKKDL